MEHSPVLDVLGILISIGLTVAILTLAWWLWSDDDAPPDET